jgi:nucleoside-triphosphatase
MDTCFLLTGKARMGKTTSIKNIINRVGYDNFGGFYTEEVRDTANRVGFNCVSLSGESQQIADVNSTSSVRVGRYGVEVQSFEKFALPEIRQSLYTKRVTVVDEIGFMQMLSLSFQKLIEDIILSGEHIILGTICLHTHPWIDKIKQLPGLKIYGINEDNRDRITEVVACEIVNIIKSDT